MNYIINQYVKCVPVLGLILILSACVTDNTTSYKSASYIIKNNEIYNNQLIKNLKNYYKGNNVFFFGFALWGGESWSENDIVDLKSTFSNFYPNRKLYSFIFSNKETSVPGAYPSIQDDLINRSLNFVKKRVSDRDIVIFSFSSHGRKNKIANKIGNTRASSINSKTIKGYLSKFSQYNKIIIISSCYSGSFINNIKDRRSVIFTAASKDNKSFGCGPTDTNTWFVTAFTEAFDKLKMDQPKSKLTLGTIFSKTKEIVSVYEISENKIPSNPQLFIGNKVDKSIIRY